MVWYGMQKCRRFSSAVEAFQKQTTRYWNGRERYDDDDDDDAGKKHELSRAGRKCSA
jgi:hypothetical protein